MTGCYICADREGRYTDRYCSDGAMLRLDLYSAGLKGTQKEWTRASDAYRLHQHGPEVQEKRATIKVDPPGGAYVSTVCPNVTCPNCGNTEEFEMPVRYLESFYSCSKCSRTIYVAVETKFTVTLGRD